MSHTFKTFAICGSVFLFTLFNPVHASEKDELALILIQLSQIESTLDRAQSVASDSRHERYFFDYKRAREDIATIRRGINNYLEPSRAQPSTENIIGRYKGEK